MIMKSLHQQYWQRLYILEWFLFSEETVQKKQQIVAPMIPVQDIVNIFRSHGEGG